MEEEDLFPRSYIYIYIWCIEYSIHIVDDKAPNVFTNVEKKLEECIPCASKRQKPNPPVGPF
jgi:hypothetical protein